MSHLLDTNVCIAFLSGRDAAVRDALEDLAPGEAVLCSVVKAELLYGARNSGRVQANLAVLERFFSAFGSLPFDDEAAERYGVLRAQLRREGRPVGGNDMMIAATALAHDAVLVTRDRRELAMISGLRCVAW